MPPLSNYAANKEHDAWHNKAALTSPANLHCALCTVAPKRTDTGSTITEVAYTSYGRVSTGSADWSAAANGDASNANAVVWPKCTGGSATAKYFARTDAASGGNLIDWAPLGTQARKPVTSITRSGTTATATVSGHGYSNGDEIDISGADQAEYNGNFTITVVDANTFTYTVSGTPATPATGDIFAQKIESLAISNNIRPEIAAGLITLKRR